MDRKVLQVSQVNRYIKGLMDRDYVLQNIGVQGEVSNYKLHSSGHAYFTLKDKDAAISCVFFKGHRSICPLDMIDGDKVIVTGNVSVYERSGQYQVYVKEAVKDGLGLLYQKFELLKREFEAKGYFDSNIKKVIPKYASKIGIVTSKTGAAIQDMINVSKRRNPYARLYLYPALVQGDGAYKDIIKGINYFNNHKQVDVIIIGRGGGSIEDLWAFNERDLIECIYKSQIPIISAVGHETDFTLADFVSDMRAPTPSAGAELAVFDYNQFIQLLDNIEHKLDITIESQLEHLKQVMNYLELRLKPKTLIHVLGTKKAYLSELNHGFNYQIKNKLNKVKQIIELSSVRLEALNPTEKLKNGFAYIYDNEHKPIKSVDDIGNNDQLNIRLHNGTIETLVKSKAKNEEV